MHNRLGRDEDYQLPTNKNHEDSNAHLWAVSYSDLLMVLLSFFILFFSFEDQKGGAEKLFKEISIGLNRTTSNDASQPGKRVPATDIQNTDIQNIKKLIASESSFEALKTEKDTLTVHINETLFDSGSIVLSGAGAAKVEKLIHQLAPYSSQIRLNILGHTDTAPVTRTRAAANNLDLSALRATGALRFAQKLGFSKDRMTASGAGESQMGLRTLSFVIQYEKGHSQ